MATALDSPVSAKGANDPRSEVKVGDPQFTLIWNTDASISTYTSWNRAARKLLGGSKGKPGRRARRRQHEGIRPRNVYWLVESKGPGTLKSQRPRPRRDLQVVCRLLGRIRRIANRPLAGPREARRPGQSPSWQVQCLNERSKIYTLNVASPGGKTAAMPLEGSP